MIADSPLSGFRPSGRPTKSFASPRFQPAERCGLGLLVRRRTVRRAAPVADHTTEGHRGLPLPGLRDNDQFMHVERAPRDGMAPRQQAGR